MIFDENGYEEALSATQAMADLTAKTVGKIYIDVALFKECYKKIRCYSVKKNHNEIP